MTALPSDYDSDPGRYLASTEWPHDDVRPYVAARLADVGARAVLDVGGGTGKLARLLPGLPMRCLCTTTAIRARHRGSPSRTHGRPRPRWTCRWH